MLSQVEAVSNLFIMYNIYGFFREGSAGTNSSTSVATLASIINGLRSSTPAPPTTSTQAGPTPNRSTSQQAVTPSSTQTSAAAVINAQGLRRNNGPAPASSLPRTANTTAYPGGSVVNNSSPLTATVYDTTTSTSPYAATIRATTTRAPAHSSTTGFPAHLVPAVGGVLAGSHGESGLVAAPDGQILNYNTESAQGAAFSGHNGHQSAYSASGLTAAGPLTRTSYSR
jgi:hypothetical protein